MLVGYIKHVNLSIYKINIYILRELLQSNNKKTNNTLC